LTGIKELIEDSKRFWADMVVNNSLGEVFCYNSMKFVTKEWKNIKVGEIVRVKNDKSFPADLVLLST
jgi:phospholipid-transporting ATPase